MLARLSSLLTFKSDADGFAADGIHDISMLPIIKAMFWSEPSDLSVPICICTLIFLFSVQRDLQLSSNLCLRGRHVNCTRRRNCAGPSVCGLALMRNKPTKPGYR